MAQFYDLTFKNRLSERMKSTIIDVPDFPKPGIIFKDITPILADVELFSSLVKFMSSAVPSDTNKIAAIDARGFLIAAPVAVELRLPLIICRKPGKLPGETLKTSYDLEYGSNELCIRKNSIFKNEGVFIIDDLLATGGTARASANLCRDAGAKVTGFGFLVELGFLNGRRLLENSSITTVTTYDVP